jgi:hypothetical protein
VSGLHAVRVAARLRRELQTQVELVHAQYGEFKVLVDDQVVIAGGPLGILGVLPSSRRVVDVVKAALAGEGNAGSTP